MKFNLSILLRGFGFLLILFILIVAAVQFLPKPSPEAIIEATVAAGVEARSTAIAVQTGTPNPTQIQSTVNAIVEATVNAPTPEPRSATEQVADGAEGIVGSIWGIIISIWNFMGFFGIYSQVCCCLLPFGLVVMGAASDRARPS